MMVYVLQLRKNDPFVDNRDAQLLSGVFTSKEKPEKAGKKVLNSKMKFSIRKVNQKGETETVFEEYDTYSVTGKELAK